MGSPIAWMERLIALAVALQTVELLLVRRVAADDGIWAWPVLKDEIAPLPSPLRQFLGLLLPYRAFVAVLWLRLAGACLLPWLAHPALPGWLWLSTVLIAVRWRGTFNGGSDYMTLIVLGALAVARAAGEGTPAAQGCLWFVALQACLSYFVAGAVKARSRDWRQGRALAGFLRVSNYDVPPALQALASSPGACRLASLGVILFECSFPLALVDRRACVAYLAAALAFHLGNVYAFGLNRFVFAWAAAYPALLACAGALRSAR